MAEAAGAAAAAGAATSQRRRTMSSPTASSPTAPPQDNKYLVQKDPDPHNIREMTTDVAGPFTQASIDKIIELQKRSDAFSYDAQDSDGGRVTDNGTDPLYAFQSNFNPIMRALQADRDGAQLDDDDLDISELAGVGDGELQRMRDEALQRMADDRNNGEYVVSERSRFHKLQGLAREVNIASESGRKAAKALHVLEVHDEEVQEKVSAANAKQAQGSALGSLGSATVADFDPLAPRDESSVTFDIRGDIDRQTNCFNALLKLRNDQLNAALDMITTLRSIATVEMLERVKLATRLEDAPVNYTNDEVKDMKSRLDSMAREQEFLYRELYGPGHKTDPRVDLVKRTRREIDETYKDMVEAEVTRRLDVIMNLDVQSQRVRSDIRKFKFMMERTHRTLNETRWITKTAVRANVLMEKAVMEQHDEYLVEQQFSQAAERAAAAHEKAMADEAATMRPSPSGSQGPYDASFSAKVGASLRDGAPATPQLRAAIASLAQTATNAANAAVESVADAARIANFDEESVQVMSAAISETGSVLSSALGTATTQMMAVLQVVPPQARRAVVDASTKTLVAQGNHVIDVSMRQLCQAVLLPVKDTQRIFDKTIDTIRNAERREAAADAGVASMSDSGVGRAALERAAQSGGRKGKRRTVLDAAFPKHRTDAEDTPMTGQTPAETPRIGVEFDLDDHSDASQTPRQSSSPSERRRTSNIVFTLEDGGQPESPHDGDGDALHTKSPSSRRRKAKPGHSDGGSGRGRHLKSGTTESGAESLSSSRRGSLSRISGPSTPASSKNRGAASSSASRGPRKPSLSVATTLHGKAKAARGKVASSSSRNPGDRSPHRGSSAAVTPAETSLETSPAGATGQAMLASGDSPLLVASPVSDTLRGADDDETLYGGSMSASRIVVPTNDVSTMTDHVVVNLPRKYADAPVLTDPEPSCRDPQCRLHDDSRAAGKGDGADDLVLRPKRPTLLQSNAARFNEASIVFVCFGLPAAAWNSFVGDSTEIVAAITHSLGDIALEHGGFIFHTDTDNVGLLFRDAIASMAFAADAQRVIRDADYSARLLELPDLVTTADLSGRLQWRGIRPFIGISRGAPFVVPHSNVPGDNTAGPEVASHAVLEAAALTLRSCRPGDIVLSEAQLEASASSLNEDQWPTQGVAPPPKDAFTKPEHLLVRSATFTHGVIGDQTVFSMDVTPELKRPLGQAAHIAAVDAKAATKKKAGGSAGEAATPPPPPPLVRLSTWVDGLRAKLTNAGMEKLCFLALEIQDHGGTPITDARFNKIVGDAQQVALAEIHTLVQRYDGLVVSEHGLAMLTVFPSVEKGMGCCLAAHVRVLQLHCGPDLLRAAPWASPVYLDDSLTWRGLALRAGAHLGRPEQVVRGEDLSMPAQYRGSEVSRALAIASHARFGETLVSDAVVHKMQRAEEELGAPEWQPAGRKVVLGRLLELTAVQPRLLKARWSTIKPLPTPLPRPVLDPAAFAATDATASGGSDGSASGAAAAQWHLPSGDPAGSVAIRISFRTDGTDGRFLALQADDATRYEVAVPQRATKQTASMMRAFSSAVQNAASQARIAFVRRSPTTALLLASSVKTAVALALSVVEQFAQVVAATGDTALQQQDSSMPPPFAVSVGIDVGPMLVTQDPSGEHRLLGNPVVWSAALATLVAHPGEVALSAAARAALAVEVLPATLTFTDAGDVAGLGQVTIVSRTDAPAGDQATGTRWIAGSVRADGAGSSQGANGRRGAATDETALTSMASDPSYHDVRLPIQLASRAQHVYRAAWKTGYRATRAVGYPVAMDLDPVAADVDLRGAILSGDEAAAGRLTSDMLATIHLLLEDVCLALSCKAERTAKYHRTQQTAIMIAPFEREDALYKTVDVGVSKHGGRGASDEASGLRPGMGATMAERIRERHVADLEISLKTTQGQLDELRAQVAHLNGSSGTTAGTLVVGDHEHPAASADDIAWDVPSPAHQQQRPGHASSSSSTALVPRATSSSGARKSGSRGAGAARTGAVVPASGSAPSVLGTSSGAGGARVSQVSSMQRARRPATTPTPGMTAGGRSALSPLHVPYQPAPASMSLQGEACDDQSQLARPFSRGPAPNAGTTSRHASGGLEVKARSSGSSAAALGMPPPQQGMAGPSGRRLPPRASTPSAGLKSRTTAANESSSSSAGILGGSATNAWVTIDDPGDLEMSSL